MAYNRNFQYGGGNNGRSYNNRSSFGFGGYNDNQPQRQRQTYNRPASGGRKSGAKFKREDKNGSPCTTGWMLSKRHGFLKFLCVVTGASKSGTSKSGKSWVTVMVKVEKAFSDPITVSGIMNSSNGNVKIDSWGIVVLPTAKNGGFIGRLPK